VLSNDRPGDSSAPLDPASVVLRDPGDGKDKKTVTVADEGVFAVGADGVITFTSVKDFIGSTRSLAYRVTDANGTTGSALLDVTVDAPRPAQATADSATGTPGGAVAVNPSLNDSGSAAPICLRVDAATCTRTATASPQPTASPAPPNSPTNAQPPPAHPR
jgi:CshA-type fibril repeat protein